LETVTTTQKKGVETNSIFGGALFLDAKLGNYTVKEESPAFKIGFKNIAMDSFGVTNTKLKSLAKTPTIPTMFFGDSSEKDAVVDWLGAQIKSISTMAERSASGLNKTAGALILAIDPQTVIGNSPLQVGDVIISAEGDEINTVADLMKTYQNNNWKGKLNLTIFRNQKEKQISLTTKK
ncbi:unnamed protein product, partial [Scytosiphon promiscuus]